MALGVLNNLPAIYAENNLNNTNASLQTVLQQLSSGSRINSGADDAAGLSLINGLEANSVALTQSGTNATEGVGLLQVADGALSQVTSLLDRAVALATEASNGTLNSTQEGAANQEYQSILAEITNIGSTTTYNQEQVFDGTVVSIYTGDSSTEGSSVDDLNIHSLSSSGVGDTNGAMSYSNGQSNVFIDLSKNGTDATLGDAFVNGTTTLNVYYMATGAGGAVATQNAQISVGGATGYADTVAGMISAINNANLGLTATFSTAAQAGKQAVAAGTSTDTGIQLSGPDAGVGSGNAPGSLGSLALPVAGAGHDADVLSGTLAVTDSSGVTHTLNLGMGAKPTPCPIWPLTSAASDTASQPLIRPAASAWTPASRSPRKALRRPLCPATSKIRPTAMRPLPGLRPLRFTPLVSRTPPAQPRSRMRLPRRWPAPPLPPTRTARAASRP